MLQARGERGEEPAALRRAVVQTRLCSASTSSGKLAKQAAGYEQNCANADGACPASLAPQNARATNDAFKRTPMRMAGGGGTGGVMDMNASGGMGGLGLGGLGGHGASPVCTEAEDRRREEEEADFTLAPEDLKE